jgi:hypothetical protein
MPESPSFPLCQQQTNCANNKLSLRSTNCLLAVLLIWDGLVGFGFGLFKMLGAIFIVFLVIHSAHPKFYF